MLEIRYTQRQQLLSKSSRLLFPEHIKTIEYDSHLIVLSPITANWLSLTQAEHSLFIRLEAGATIGEVFDFARTSNLQADFQSLMAHLLSREFGRTDVRPEPIAEPVFGAHLYLTNACNLRCTHCYMDSGKAEARELSVDEWVRVIDTFADCGGKSITFSGGEFLAKRGWLEILGHAAKRNIPATALTNGTMWTPGLIKTASPLLAEAQISVDGPSEAVNSITRGNGNFALALETARTFAEHGVRTSVAMTPTQETINLFEKDFFKFFTEEILPYGINLKISQKLLADRANTKLSEVKEQEYLRVTKKLSDLIYPTASIRAFALDHKPNQIQGNCGLGGLTVSAQGDIYPCNRISELVDCGNVRDGKLQEAIRALSRVDELTRVENISPCKYCDLRYICGGGCRLDDYILRDRINRQPLSFSQRRIDTSTVLEKRECTEKYRQSIFCKMLAVRSYLHERAS